MTIRMMKLTWVNPLGMKTFDGCKKAVNRLQTFGQVFVDEVFRVFAVAHPHVRLKTMGLKPEVAKLLKLFGA